MSSGREGCLLIDKFDLSASPCAISNGLIFFEHLSQISFWTREILGSTWCLTAVIFATVLGNNGFILNLPPAFLTTASSATTVFARISSQCQIQVSLSNIQILITYLGLSYKAHFEWYLHTHHRLINPAFLQKSKWKEQKSKKTCSNLEQDRCYHPHAKPRHYQTLARCDTCHPQLECGIGRHCRVLRLCGRL